MFCRKTLLSSLAGLTGTMVLGAFCMVSLVSAAGTATVAATVTVQNISVTVSDGSISYGTLPANTATSTIATALNDTQTGTNAGNVAEDFNIKGQNSANWTLAATTAADQYIHKFCIATCSNPVNFTVLTTSYQVLASNIAANGTKTFDLQITTPNPSTVFTQQSVDVTVQAVLK
ncbi:hypothetical protein EXS71_03935 [Candidatus Uhrbacteria bacterium]|nr:hypothetical protein [Candidatus Uhrbacteria bacterium]